MTGFLNFILFVAMWAAGYFVYVLFGLQIMITLFTSIPLTKMCFKFQDFDIKFAKTRITITILLNLIILSAVIALLLLLATSAMKYGFLTGAILAFATSIRKLSWRIKDNVKDYIKAFRLCFPNEDIMTDRMASIIYDNYDSIK